MGKLSPGFLTPKANFANLNAAAPPRPKDRVKPASFIA